MERVNRRRFISGIAVGGAALVTDGGRAVAQGASGAASPPPVTPTEDLMREHGVLRRVLLVWEEGVRRLRAGAAPPLDVFASSARLIQRFIEGYHEKLEEEEVFPRLVKAGKLVELTRVLLQQHEAGRKLTTRILALAAPGGASAPRDALVAPIEAFIAMYRPHAAREDTVLFPVFQTLFTEKEFDELGDRFEDRERQVLGGAGFEGAVREVAQLERSLGIEDLARFTPR